MPTMLLAFGTMFWSYASKSLFAEPLLALCTIAAFYSVRCHRQSGSYWALLIAGVWVGWGILTKTTAFALVPWLALYAVWPRHGSQWEMRPMRMPSCPQHSRGGSHIDSHRNR